MIGFYAMMTYDRIIGTRQAASSSFFMFYASVSQTRGALSRTRPSAINLKKTVPLARYAGLTNGLAKIIPQVLVF